ncbi:uncharacterized protein CYBJADRAFT_168004 [Cyberlindnera jadinii NRRL Y-1542]|uniref:Uncharacterized protein n=1 Tax=Cyberlindnera jadinii (strain ATCC 18201 / CBS 1600 / BCRC 20928 / JCM 3617 / NBRC 0987 / NRRL Y-1542) TaxID=983966 RepID=A0A1E4S0A4_CYBJN|nr:hypothetical protein CYBJADRAFT_168004 [Cyberlindnera jadinii NRRL Y-1542]ODV72924.1 hypothetical protein CYBJADRAFT_168004 [Cyberlindnera jadinii NRRL Y-1542]
MAKNNRLNNKGKNPRGRPRRIRRTLNGPQRQVQTNGGTRQLENSVIIETD